MTRAARSRPHPSRGRRRDYGRRLLVVGQDPAAIAEGHNVRPGAGIWELLPPRVSRSAPRRLFAHVPAAGARCPACTRRARRRSLLSDARLDVARLRVAELPRCPPSLVRAMSEKLKPSEYKGTISRLPSMSTALFFVCHPIRR